MTPADLLDTLTDAGIRLTTDGERLHVTPPPTGCPDDLRARIVASKLGLIELVRMRDRLLTLAREIGVPDRIVVNLPARELRTTRDQMPLWPDSELQRRVLMYYLRRLTGSETGAKPIFRNTPLSPTAPFLTQPSLSAANGEEAKR